MTQAQGNISEIEFMSRAIKKGFSISKPMFVEKYDCLVDNGKHLLKIQIKSTNFKSKTSYSISLLHGSKKKEKYTAGQVDYIVIHIPNENIWYIIPFREAATHLHLHPWDDGCRYDKYKEAWNILCPRIEIATNETLKL
jgi:hypothetical protein